MRKKWLQIFCLFLGIIAAIAIVFFLYSFLRQEYAYGGYFEGSSSAHFFLVQLVAYATFFSGFWPYFWPLPIAIALMLLLIFAKDLSGVDTKIVAVAFFFVGILAIVILILALVSPLISVAQSIKQV